MIVGLISRNQRPDEGECLGLFLASGGEVVHVMEVIRLWGWPVSWASRYWVIPKSASASLSVSPGWGL